MADLIVIALAATLALVGWYQGAVAALLTLLGFAMGALVGGGLARLLLEGGRSSQYIPLATLVGGISFALLFSTVFHDIYRLLQRRYEWRVPPLDHTLGAALGAIVGIGVSWAAAAVIVTSPGAEALRQHVLASNVLVTLNEYVPSPTGIFGSLVQHDPLPVLDGAGRHIDAPPDDVPANDAIRAAVDSVVQVQGTACGYGVTGSGWVAAPHLVVTNVHVVAGQDDTTIRLHDGRRMTAVPVAIEPGDDIAVLRVAQLELPALRAARRAPSGGTPAIVGFPAGKGRTVRPARLGSRERVRATDAFGAHQVERELVGFRGPVRHGNSGGVLLDGTGSVLGTVFAAAAGGGNAGGFAVPNDVVESIVAEAGTKRVDSGCAGT